MGINCNYVDIESFTYNNNKKDFSLFHLNIASITKHKDELETILNMLDYKFDICMYWRKFDSHLQKIM